MPSVSLEEAEREAAGAEEARGGRGEALIAIARQSWDGRPTFDKAHGGVARRAQSPSAAGAVLVGDPLECWARLAITAKEKGLIQPQPCSHHRQPRPPLVTES